MSDADGSPGTHTGRRLAGDRAYHQAHHDQSTSSPSTAVAHDGHGASRVVDVGGRGIRTRTNLKNPSTTLPAESSPLQVHQRTRGPTTDGAARKWSAVLRQFHPPGPFKAKNERKWADLLGPQNRPYRPTTTATATTAITGSARVASVGFHGVYELAVYANMDPIRSAYAKVPSRRAR